MLSPRRGCGQVGVASGPGKFSWEVGNYAIEVGNKGCGQNVAEIGSATQCYLSFCQF